MVPSLLFGAFPDSPPKMSLQFQVDTPASAAVLAILSATQTSALVALEPASDGGETQLQVSAGVALHGVANIARHLVRLAPSSAPALYAGDALRLACIDEFLGIAERLAAAGVTVDAAGELLSELNAHLAMRTFVGAATATAPSVADVALWAALPGAVRAAGAGVDAFLAKLKLMHVRRWFAHVGALPELAGVAAAAASGGAPAVKQRVVGKAGTVGSLSKIDVGGSVVVTRFPPEPSGYLHIGHVKAAMLNNAYARNCVGGRLHCRFDDTNPEKEKTEFEHAILTDLASIGIVPDSVSNTSDFFGKFIEFCEKFIRDGNAFVDNTPIEAMREERGAGAASACRGQSVDENLRLWDEMVKGTPAGLACCVRAKIDPAHPNTALRDPAIYRCKLTPHYRTGTKFKVYPMYDFACPIIDSLEGVTHALRSSEYTSRNPLYTWVAEKAGLRVPKIEDFSRLNFEYVLLSKRKLQKLVETGVVGGWDDPRFPTIRGILRRGMEPSVLRDFILSQGASKSTVCMTMDKLWVLNKDHLDKIVHRHVALPAAGIVPLTLVAGDGLPNGVDVRPVEKHPKRPELGTFAAAYARTLWIAADDAALLAADEELTLVKWGNVVVTRIDRDAAGRVTAIDARLHLAGDPRATKNKITWLPRIDAGTPGADQGHLVDVLLQEFGYLITVKTLDDDADFDSVVNKNSLLETRAYGAQSMRSLAVGDKIQIMRNGYYRVDAVATDKSPLKLIKIPDGSRGPLSPPADNN
jgi:glutamyl-tRNA synthetase